MNLSGAQSVAGFSFVDDIMNELNNDSKNDFTESEGDSVINTRSKVLYPTGRKIRKKEKEIFDKKQIKKDDPIYLAE